MKSHDSALAREFPHLVVLSHYAGFLTNEPYDVALYHGVTNWIGDLGEDNYAYWSPWDACPIAKRSSNALVGFKDFETFLLFKLTFPESVVQYVDFNSFG